MKKWILLFLLIPVLLGCSQLQTQIVKFDDANADLTLKGAKQIMKHWGMNSSAIHVGLGDEIINTKMPVEFGKALARLDEFELKYGKDQSTMTEKDAGNIVTLVYGKLLMPVATELFKQYAPGILEKVLKYLPSFITL